MTERVEHTQAESANLTPRSVRGVTSRTPGGPPLTADRTLGRVRELLPSKPRFSPHPEGSPQPSPVRLSWGRK